jgi:hypothetical protein
MIDNFCVDLISDLNLSETDKFDWEGKATSLFCVVAGNVSDDLDVLRKTLEHLSSNYRGVFFIDGSLEHVELQNYESRIELMKQICNSIENVVYLHNHVVILNNVAFIGVNGWHNNRKNIQEAEDLDYIAQYKNDDLSYLSNTMKQLQAHIDVKKIVVISNSMPSDYLNFNSPDAESKTESNLALSLLFDYGVKTKVWLFGTDDIAVDVEIGSRRFVNNPVTSGLLYWPKRIVI